MQSTKSSQTQAQDFLLPILTSPDKLINDTIMSGKTSV